MKNLTYKGIPISLLELQAEVNRKTRNKSNALMEAAYHGNTQTITLLLDRGDDVNAQTKNGNTALMYAALNGHTEIVSLLIDHGADTNNKDNHGYTALMLAAENAHTETINLLLERGADINAKDNDGNTALMITTIHIHTKIVKLLLERGADINATDINGKTALMLAARNGHSKTINVLLNNGANINATDTNGKAALMMAALGEPEIVTLLLDRGANINAKDNNGETALMMAMLFRHKNTFRPLLERGSDLPDDKSHILSTMEQASWWTPLHTAVISDKLPKRNGFHYKDSKKITPLDIAIMIGNLDAVKNIIGPNIKCDVNDCLRKSIFSKRNEVARFFLENGANPSSKNKRGQTVFHIATATNNYHIIRTIHEFSLFQKNNAAKLIQNNFRLSLFHSKERNFLSDEIYQNIKSMRIS